MNINTYFYTTHLAQTYNDIYSNKPKQTKCIHTRTLHIQLITYNYMNTIPTKIHIHLNTSLAKKHANAHTSHTDTYVLHEIHTSLHIYA